MSILTKKSKFWTTVNLSEWVFQYFQFPSLLYIDIDKLKLFIQVHYHNNQSYLFNLFILFNIFYVSCSKYPIVFLKKTRWQLVINKSNFN